MKKLLFIIVAVFSVLVFKPTAEGALLSVVDGIEEGYIIDTTDEEMEVISNSRSLLPPAVRTFSGLSLVNNTGKNTTNHYCKSLHCDGSLLIHRCEEFGIGLGQTHLLLEELHSLDGSHIREVLAQNPGAVHNLAGEEQILATCA